MPEPRPGERVSVTEDYGPGFAGFLEALRKRSDKPDDALGKSVVDRLRSPEFASEVKLGSEDQLVVASVERDTEGARSVKLHQTHRGRAVHGSHIVVVLGPDEKLLRIRGTLYPSLDVGAEPSVPAERAKDAGIAHAGQGTPESEPELVVYPSVDGDHLAWRFVLHGQDERGEPATWFYFVDAQTGDVLFRIGTMHGFALIAESGVGYGTLGERRPLGILRDSTAPSPAERYRLVDTSRGFPIETHDLRNEMMTACQPGPLSFSDDEQWDGLADQAAVDLHYYLGVVCDYFLRRHKRQSWDGAGAPVVGIVHVGHRWKNATWSPSCRVFSFGDGDGTSLNYAAALDIVAHEFTHAVTDTTAGLMYYGESGALNEAFSDIFAAVIDDADWIIGEDIAIGGPDRASRNMADPTKGGRYDPNDDLPTLIAKEVPQPDHYARRYQTTADYGGVHINSGILNKFAYLLCDGGEHSNILIDGIGRYRASMIFYRALTFEMSASDGFKEARAALEQASRDVFPGDHRVLESVWRAAEAVGLPR